MIHRIVKWFQRNYYRIEISLIERDLKVLFRSYSLQKMTYGRYLQESITLHKKKKFLESKLEK